jgi:hypothetical protein
VNLPLDADALDDTTTVFCYFSRLTDKKHRRLTALRRAAQFKGALRSRFLRLVTDSLKLIQDPVFKLDSDFDLLIDSQNLHVLRPASFEFAGKLQDAILKAVPDNIVAVAKDLPFIDFDGIETYAGKHPRAARYLASIRSLKESKNVDKAALKKLCHATDVEFKEVKGKLVVNDAHVMGFLEVLDRRRYELELVKGTPERFRAASRQKLTGVSAK